MILNLCKISLDICGIITVTMHVIQYFLSTEYYCLECRRQLLTVGSNSLCHGLAKLRSYVCLLVCHYLQKVVRSKYTIYNMILFAHVLTEHLQRLCKGSQGTTYKDARI